MTRSPAHRRAAACLSLPPRANLPPLGLKPRAGDNEAGDGPATTRPASHLRWAAASPTRGWEPRRRALPHTQDAGRHGLPLAFATSPLAALLGSALFVLWRQDCRRGAPGLWPASSGARRLAVAKAAAPATGLRALAAANTVLCSRRLYIVQSGQRRKTGYVKGGND